MTCRHSLRASWIRGACCCLRRGALPRRRVQECWAEEPTPTRVVLSVASWRTCPHACSAGLAPRPCARAPRGDGQSLQPDFAGQMAIDKAAGADSLGPPPCRTQALPQARCALRAQREAQGCPTGRPWPVEPCSCGSRLASAPGTGDSRARGLQLAQTSSWLCGPWDPAGWQWPAAAGSKCVGPLGPVPASTASAFWCEGPGPGASPWPRDSSPPQGGALLLAGWHSASEAGCRLFGGSTCFFSSPPRLALALAQGGKFHFGSRARKESP